MSFSEEVLRRAFRDCVRNRPELSTAQCMKQAEVALIRARRQANLSGSGLGSLGRTQHMLTRGYQDGKRAWIDVYPNKGPKMRITHEVFEGVLTSSARARIPARRFALPGRRYPIHDCSHARNALSRASMSYHRGNLTRKEHATVVRKARAAMRRLCR